MTYSQLVQPFAQVPAFEDGDLKLLGKGTLAVLIICSICQHQGVKIGKS